MAEDWTDLIQEVKRANDVVEVVGSYLSLRPAGKTFKGLCPFHDDSKPSLDVDPQRQRYRCWACGKHGDVITFLMEFEHLGFWDALELLARRAGISLEKAHKSQQNSDRAVMLESVRWAEQQFQRCLLETTPGEAARIYLGERKLTGETVRKYGLGYAPAAGDWLVQLARQADQSPDILEKVGLLGRRKEGKGHYDFFRDRVMFSIRDPQGQTVGFAGRLLPNSPMAGRAGKYINTPETPLFFKSQLLYGLDQARQAAARVGYLAVVEGYTDVLMAHQMGVMQVVAPMGTALTDRHVKLIRRFVNNVVLVFDADAGGNTGVDRALALVASNDVSLRIATLPEGLDPCDVLTQRGVETFTLALTNAQDVLEFKLNQVCQGAGYQGVEGQSRAIDEVLRIMALGERPDFMKTELMLTRIAQRFGITQETLRSRLEEIRARRQTESSRDDKKTEGNETVIEEKVRQAPARAHEKQLLEILLSEPKLVAETQQRLAAEQIEHPGLRLLLNQLYRLVNEGTAPTLDNLRTRLENNALLAKAFELQDRGESYPDKKRALADLLKRFDELKQATQKQEIQRKLHAAEDRQSEQELLRRLQNRES